MKGKKLLFLNFALLAMTLTSCDVGGTIVSSSSTETKSSEQPSTSEVTPAESSEEAPAETSEEIPAETSEEAPTETSEEIPAESSEEAPVETSETEPVGTSEEIPVVTSEEELESSHMESRDDTSEIDESISEIIDISSEETPVESSEEPIISSEEPLPESSEDVPAESSESPMESSEESGGSEYVRVDEDTGDVYFNGKLKIWYHRDDLNYTDLVIYLWNISVDGQQYEFTGKDTEYGMIFEINLWESEQFANAMSNDIRMIIKPAGTWSGQSDDTICEFKDFDYEMDGEIPVMNIYSAAGENKSIDLYRIKSDALGDHLDSVYFSNWTTLNFNGTGVPTGRAASEVGKISRYEVFRFDATYYRLNADQQAEVRDQYKIISANANSNKISVTLPDGAQVNPSYIYVVDAYFALNPTKRTFKAASVKKLYDTSTFTNNYTYAGDDLGVTFGADGFRTFKLWAPTCARVALRLYQAGTPASLDPKSAGANLNSEIEMELGENGVWSVTETADWKLIARRRKYYTFVVTNSNGTQEVTDPYAKAAGVNGVRGYTYNFAEDPNAPEGWNGGKGVDDSLSKIASANNLSVYEAHIRDLTADATWTSNNGYRRGGYNAFAEEGTTYTKGSTTVKTGFDHIKELGVNAIQLLPVFDQDNDERIDSVYSSTEGEGTLVEKTYNWGYNPQNFNVVEGAYSSDPKKAEVRIGEYKNLVLTAAKSDIRIVMDVVYNHMASAANSVFTKIIPGYFFRTDANGNYWDGTGVGNVTASERKMVSKYIADSVAFWAKEYRIKGFRFDLMGCLDIDTMKAVRAAVNKIDPTIVLYGEGWNGNPGGDAGYDSGKLAGTDNIYSKLNTNSAFPIGGFNDCGRDGTKGNTKWADVVPQCAQDDGGSNFLTQGSPSTDAIYNCLTQIIGENRWVKERLNTNLNPNQTVNYVACHDNYALYDQLAYQFSATNEDNNKYVKDACLAAQSIATFGQGIAFINGGDEIFRRKVMSKNSPLFDALVESYQKKTDGKSSWIEGDGIKINNDKWLVRNSYKYGDEVNSYKWDRKADNLAYFNRFADLFKLRAKEMGNTLGQNIDDVKKNLSYCWSSDDLQPGSRIIAGGFTGKKDSKNVYLFLANDLGAASDTMGIGNGQVEVLYSSTGGHTVGSKISITNYKITVNKYECLIVRRLSD